ncbi:MAG: glycosyltransferase family 4 protein [Nitrososphaerota archaeon]
MRARKILLIQFSDFGLGRGLYIAKALSRLGLNVVVITNEPVYTSGNSSLKNIDPDVEIVKVKIPLPKVLYNLILGRLIFYLMFSLLSFLRIMVEKPRPQLIYSRGPNPFTELVCSIYKLLNRDVKIISDTTDIWPDALKYIEMSDTAKNFLILLGHVLNRICYANVDAIVTLNEMMARVLKNRFRKDVYIIHGAIDLDSFKPLDKKEALSLMPKNLRDKIAGKFVILYAGLLGYFQDPAIIIELAKRINIEDVLFLIVGAGSLRRQMELDVEKLKLKNVVFLGSQPHEKMPLIYGLADVFIFTLRKNSFLSNAVPKKFIEYAACGKPILCVTPPCIASSLCLEWGAGYWFDPEKMDDVVKIIISMREDERMRKALGKNARKMAEELFSIDNVAKVLEGIIFS